VSDVETAEIMRRFNDAFVRHDASALADLVADDCVMEAVQPAPNGLRVEGRDACVAFWKRLAEDRVTQFEPEDVAVAGDRAVIRWRYHFGEGEENTVRGVNLMRVRDGRIVEALGYSKVPAEKSIGLPSSTRA
jgi:ketosteroid isomerase-like protein